MEKTLYKYEQLLGKKRKVGDSLKLFLTIKEGLKEAWKPLQSGIEEKFNDTGIDELLPAVKAGILEINLIGANKEDFEDDKFTEIMIENIRNAITGNDKYPLFDENIGNLVGTLSKEGLIAITNIDKRRATHIAFTSDILSRLPSFPDQTIDELIDIRKDLEKYLVRFRSAMTKYSSSIDSLPWDGDFTKECDQLMISDIEPAICEIEEQIKSNSYLRKLTKTMTTEPLTIGPATGLGFIISSLSALSTLSSVGLGLATGTAVALGKSINDWKTEQGIIEKNQLYFYYRAYKKTTI